jgi:membrane-associated phospholipid phosphatase
MNHGHFNLSWYLITEAGGMQVLGTLGLVLAIWLCCERQWRLALNWVWGYGGVMALVVASKLLFIGWGFGSRALDFTGFSGHAMRATACGPVLAYLLFYHAPPRWRTLATMGGVLIGGLISYSRLMVHAHSLSEVLSGGALGLALAAWFLLKVGQAQRFRFNLALILVGLLGLLIVRHSEPMPTHSLMVNLTLKLTGHARPFVREGWRYDPYYCIEPKPGVTTLCRHYP